MYAPTTRWSPTGFTLVELLVVVAIIGLLSAVTLPAIARARDKARAIRCLTQMRQLSLSLHAFADDRQDTWPRSSHSAAAHGELPWNQAIAPYLGSSLDRWTQLTNGVYRCPSKKETGWRSHGLNVYFELDPAHDDYVGSPTTWRRRTDTPRPHSTVLLAEIPGSTDHVMAHFWTSPNDATDVAPTRHNGRANHLMADGHGELLPLAMTYLPPVRDHWNPSLAP
ncbi:MAG: type II secretion system protein [Verrucomicrobiae bacterium]|nr:type II secretion system protein [Verrucomicrobiae bacterium]